MFACEETGSVAIETMLGAMSSSEEVYGVLEYNSKHDEMAIPGAHRLLRVHRNGSLSRCLPEAAEAVENLVLHDQVGVAYVTGEAQTCVLIRNHLIHERG
ncbi:SIP domain-containing protein [Pseudogracilibacillus auburnensis]|uniref:SIP domain-containing protein n=1 Tax=Pseudogracilibacillus auburnensis TaxID=1494959 RepID=UPI001A96038E